MRFDGVWRVVVPGIRKKENLVFLERLAQDTSKLIALQFVVISSKRVAAVQSRVAQKPKQVAVKLIGARPV